MASPEKIGWSKLRVGVTALAALAILAVLIFLLTGSRGLFQHFITLHTYMDDASGMTESAPVRLNGLLVGNVDKIRLSGMKDPNRAVVFDLSVKQDYLRDIPEDSIAAISASNLLGDKFINITKGQSPKAVQAGGTLRSLEAQDIPELMAQSANLLKSMQDILGRLNNMLGDVEAGKGNIGKLLRDEELYRRLNAIANEGQQLMSDIRTGKGTLSRLIYDDSLYQELRAPMQKVDAILAQIQNGDGTATKLLKDPKLYEEAQAAIVEARRLIAGVNGGKGTVGKLMNDDQMYRNINQLLGKIDQTVDRVNSGQGTLGQFVVNPQLYESINGAMREFQSLGKDMRANPKKFLSIKLSLF
jgi:phospholipid/cholesterol/gamma-HCH transport system substrate-binding protein